jgi:hypothetical protein
VVYVQVVGIEIPLSGSCKSIRQIRRHGEGLLTGNPQLETTDGVDRTDYG